MLWARCGTALQHKAHGAAQVMGGRCYAVGSLRALLACVEGLAQRLAPALVASFRALPCADAPQLAQLPDATIAAGPFIWRSRWQRLIPCSLSFGFFKTCRSRK